jgi:hypothetical protein
VDDVSIEVIARERAALDRWIRGDPDGYLDIMDPEVTYFDPSQAARADGREAVAALLSPIRNTTLPFSEPRYDMLAPKVQAWGEGVALLTFNLVNYARLHGQPEAVLNRWNASEVYRRRAGGWWIAHSHWSCTKPAGSPE